MTADINSMTKATRNETIRSRAAVNVPLPSPHKPFLFKESGVLNVMKSRWNNFTISSSKMARTKYLNVSIAGGKDKFTLKIIGKRNRLLISAGLKSVLSSTEKSCIVSYYVQFSTKSKMKNHNSNTSFCYPGFQPHVAYRKAVYNMMQ